MRAPAVWKIRNNTQEEKFNASLPRLGHFEHVTWIPNRSEPCSLGMSENQLSSFQEHHMFDGMDLRQVQVISALEVVVVANHCVCEGVHRLQVPLTHTPNFTVAPFAGAGTTGRWRTSRWRTPVWQGGTTPSYRRPHPELCSPPPRPPACIGLL